MLGYIDLVNVCDRGHPAAHNLPNLRLCHLPDDGLPTAQTFLDPATYKSVRFVEEITS